MPFTKRYCKKRVKKHTHKIGGNSSIRKYNINSDSEYGFGIDSSNINSKDEFKEKLVKSFTTILEDTILKNNQTLELTKKQIGNSSNDVLVKKHDDIRIQVEVLNKMINNNIESMKDFKKISDTKFIDRLHAVPSLIFKKISEVNALVVELNTMIKNENKPKPKTIFSRFNNKKPPTIMSVTRKIRRLEPSMSVRNAERIANKLLTAESKPTTTNIKKILTLHGKDETL